MTMEISRITKEELKLKIEKNEDFVVIDVRNPIDYGLSPVKIKGAVRIPLSDIESRAQELSSGKEIITY